MSIDRREFTPHGHSTRCGLCQLRVYGLWVTEEPPPIGCADGLDDAPGTCSHVIASIQFGVIGVDHLGEDWKPHHQHLRKLIGDARFEAVVAHVRKHKAPPKAGARRDPTFADRPN